MLTALTLVAAVSGAGAAALPELRDRVPLVRNVHGAECVRSHDPQPSLLSKARQIDSLAPPAKSAATLAKSRRPGGARPLPANYVDDAIYGVLARQGIEPAAPADDTAFLRRATLDLAGRLPTVDEVRTFLESDDPQKREELVDRLLASPHAIDHWALWLRDLVGIYEPYSSVLGRNAVHSWLRRELTFGASMDHIISGVITASGETRGPEPADMMLRWLEAPATYQDAYDNMAANVGQRFLGLRLLCISCHDGAYHLENVNEWLAQRQRKQLWEMAAFFANTGIDQPEGAREVEYIDRWFEVFELPGGRDYVADTDGGDRPPRSGGVIQPAFVLGGQVPRPDEARREALARLVTADFQFARNIVNRIWQRLMVVGLVEPVNDWDFERLDPDTSSAIGPQTLHPELIVMLARDFVDSGYDLWHIVRVIASSNAYAMSTDHPDWQPSWAAYYARRLPRRLSAEEFVDAVVQAGERPVDHWVARKEKPIRWARQLPGLWDPNLDADERGLSDEESGNIEWDTFGLLNLFGRGNNYDEPRSQEGSISQSLAVMNSSLVNRRSYRGDWGMQLNRIQRLAEQEVEAGAAVEELFLATLSRFPTPAEQAAAEAALDRDMVTGLEDLFWALVNTQEFLFRP
jgi:hypothetical protein